MGELAEGPEADLDAADEPDAPSRTRSRETAIDRVGRFRAMVDGHLAFTWRALRGLGVPSVIADDAAQQVFLVALRRLDEIEPGRERSFLFGAAVGIAANARRSRARSREVVDDEAVARAADASPDPEDASSKKQERAILDGILAAMPVELSAVFVLFELEGLTMAEIAPLLSLAPGTVASRLRRAREDFRDRARRVRDATAQGKGGPR
jgi:RNA polymerase sigma-70 factor (ECF subfamily)